MMKRKQAFIAILLAAALAVTACSNDKQPTDAPVTAPIDEGNKTPEQKPETAEPPAATGAFSAPLTGLPLEKEAVQRPMAVMVNNYKAARPQSGLTQADVIWEVLAEGGITRLVAIFQSSESKEPIGPIRSIRPYLIELGELYHGVLVHAGASNDAFAILQRQHKQDLDEITNAGAYFYRDKTRKAPHNLYSTLEKMHAGAEKRKYESSVAIPSFTFADGGAGTYDGPATKLDIHFLMKDYKVSYAYDAARKVYLRSINDAPHIDLNNKEQLSAPNVVVLGAKHQVYDDYGRLKVDLSSGGPAILFQNGQEVTCEWKRAGKDVIRIMKDGKELPFIPGKVYYHIVPNNPTFAEHVEFG
ncbi:DUF3048 domain-containing protein [Paenibacillus sp. MMS18-CY102]|uniref:DUF3048 domain-containing protein n=1 Tax=Paenibacillus sp. MMS18-CY102 TaxID=2682849 RepID=UPI0013663FFA|nr:DUF3048 domain-containing protein [Paenibacillus sp. MMS18-CY102]MWC31102.1 DUF3048 domain-containing protein [Paenibacillus sp. MMS18-CY102]